MTTLKYKDPDTNEWVTLVGPGPQGPEGPSGPNPVEPLVAGIKGEVSVQLGNSRFYLDDNFGFVSMRVSVGTPPNGSSLIIDVNVDGVSIYNTQSNRPTIADGAYDAVGNSPDVVSMSAGQYISFDVDQVGSGYPGSDLVCWLRLREIG